MVHDRQSFSGGWMSSPILWMTASIALTAPRPASAETGASPEPPVLRLSSADDESSIRFQLAAQIRWEYQAIDGGQGQPMVHENEILFRRLRIIVGGSIISEDFTYRLHFNFVPGAIELIDLWIDYRFHSQVSLRLGQFKIPFTRYRLGSFSTRPMVDWSYPTRYFGAERQIGLMIHNGVGRPPRFEYQVGLYTGVNARMSNGVAMPHVYGVDRPNPSDLTDPSAPSSFHPELAAHVAYNHGNIDVRAPQDFEGGALRASVGLSAAYDIRPTLGQDMTLRIAPEAVLKVHGFTFWGVFYMVFHEEIVGNESLALGLLGAVVQASYLFLERFEVGLRYTDVSILSGLREDAKQYADQRIDDEEDADAQEALRQRLSSVGLLEAVHEVTLGFNVYLLARSLKLGVDGGPIIHQRSDRTRVDALVRIQAQLTF